jgi:hypothetical protein
MTCLMAFCLVAAVRNAFWRGVDDPRWEERWRQLNPADRTRIAAATRPRTSRIELDGPEEAELAKGFFRRDRRRCAYIELPAFIILTTLAALWLASPLSNDTFFLVFFPLLLANLLWQRIRERQLNGEIREVSPEAAP